MAKSGRGRRQTGNESDGTSRVRPDQVETGADVMDRGNPRNVTATEDEVVNATATAAANAAAATAGTGIPANPEPIGLQAVLMMLAQVLERLPAVVPAPMAPPPPPPANDPRVVNVENEQQVLEPRVPSYLKMMEHMQRLGTKFFAGGVDLVEADEWSSRLERNFKSIRCPESYKKDIAVHYLEGDAHTWWKGVAAKSENRNCSWETFKELFRSKYFPQEAFDKLEGAFLDLEQGKMTVREYEKKFNSLKIYAGKELEDEKVQVRRFMRGLRVELRNRCLVRNYATVSELVEKAALLEVGIMEESRIHNSSSSNKQSGNIAGNKRKWDQNTTSNKTIVGRSACLTCGKMHLGDCRAASGACLRCGSMDHKVRDCPHPDRRAKNPGANVGNKSCYNCGEAGHFKFNCPKLGQSSGKQANDGLPPPAKRQAIMPRVYSMGQGTNDPGTSRPITGEFSFPKHFKNFCAK